MAPAPPIAETDNDREARLLRQQLSTALPTHRQQLLFARGRHLRFRDVVGMVLAQIDGVTRFILEHDDTGQPTGINGRIMGQFNRAAANLTKALIAMREEAQDQPDSLEIRWTDFAGLPDVTPEIPARLDDLFGGVLKKRAEAERHKVRPAPER